MTAMSSSRLLHVHTDQRVHRRPARRAGQFLLSLFSSDGFGDAANQVGSQAQLLARDAPLFDDVSDKLELTGTKVRGFWVGLADKVAPVLKPLLDRFANFDLASGGQQAGEAVAFIVQAFADGKVGDIRSLRRRSPSPTRERS